MRDVLILGSSGEVGSAIRKVIEKSKLYRVSLLDKVGVKELRSKKFDVMHVCIPYDDDFIDDVADYMFTYKPQLTLIESTVKPKTTSSLYELTKLPICHSPVRGRHTEGIENGFFTYTKFIGSPRREFALEAEKYYNSLGLKAYICNSSEETEFMKLLETTYYGLLIAFAQEVRRICNKFGLNENDINAFFNTETIESGYKHMLPVKYPGVISGHCVIANAMILKEVFPSKFIDAMLDSNERRIREVQK